MPELPEVETIVRALRRAPGDEPFAAGRDGPSLLGKRFTGADLLWERSLATPDPQRFSELLPGQSVQAIRRRAKYIVLSLERDTLLIHLRMSGDLRVEPRLDESDLNRPPLPHDRVVFYFADNLRLAFNDARKFGRVWLVPDEMDVLDNLGPEPLDPALTADTFHRMLTERRRQLKPLLLDQSFLAGLGNIYTDESLHLAGLHPLGLSDQLTPVQSARLLEAIRATLQTGIRTNGASIDWVYRGGEFQNTFRAYGRTGQPCLVCGHPIERTTVGQRGTHYCPVCQPYPR